MKETEITVFIQWTALGAYSIFNREDGRLVEMSAYQRLGAESN